MHLIVTGARGFVGRELVPLLAARGHTGVATGRVPPESLPPGWRAADREAVLSNGTSTPDVDAVVHLEVRQHVPRPTAADIASFDTVNVQGTGAWLDWAARNAVPVFVFVSSIKAVRPSSEPCSEDAPLETEAPYGRSKARAERLVQDWANADPRRSAVILRPAPVYGPGNEANIAAFVRRVRAGKPCIVGAGAVRKSIVGRTNLAAAIEFTMREARAGVDIFNVSDRESLSVMELAKLIAELTHAPPPRRVPEWPARLLARLGDCLTSQLGIPFPLTTARLHALEETSLFPCDKLVAAGFRHPRTAREGLVEMLAG